MGKGQRGIQGLCEHGIFCSFGVCALHDLCIGTDKEYDHYLMCHNVPSCVPLALSRVQDCAIWSGSNQSC